MVEAKDYQTEQVYRSPLESSMLKFSGVSYEPLFAKGEIDYDWVTALGRTMFPDEDTVRSMPKTLKEIMDSSFYQDVRKNYEILKRELVKVTIEGLPVVSEATIKTMIRDFKVRENLLEEVMERIERDNPVLYSFMESKRQSLLQKGMGEEEFIIMLATSMEAFVSVYETIRRQAEANKLEEEFNGD